MSLTSFLPHRAVLAVSGPDRIAFLQGLLTNDVSQAQPGQAVWAALLTPQGKVLHEVLILADEQTLFLEVEASRIDDLAARLRKYKLRSKVEIAPRPNLRVAVTWGPDAAQAGGWRDSRHADAGYRQIVAEPNDWPTTPALWAKHRRALGLAEGAEDTGIEATFALELGLADLAGVDFTKGCYVGQETTARMKWRNLLRKRLVPVRVEGEASPGAALTAADGSEAGELRGHGDGLGLALLRLESLEKGPFQAGAARVTML